MTAARRSTIDGIEQVYTCYRADGSAYQVPSYYPARGVSIAEAATSLGLRLIGRRDTAEADGSVVAEIHDGGLSAKAVRS
jgi:hypothetical protein